MHESGRGQKSRIKQEKEDGVEERVGEKVDRTKRQKKRQRESVSNCGA